MPGAPQGASTASGETAAEESLGGAGTLGPPSSVLVPNFWATPVDGLYGERAFLQDQGFAQRAGGRARGRPQLALHRGCRGAPCPRPTDLPSPCSFSWACDRPQAGIRNQSGSAHPVCSSRDRQGTPVRPVGPAALGSFSSHWAVLLGSSRRTRLPRRRPSDAPGFLDYLTRRCWGLDGVFLGSQCTGGVSPDKEFCVNV